MQIVCWSELSAENWKNKLSAGPFLQLSAGNPADDEAMLMYHVECSWSYWEVRKTSALIWLICQS